MQATSKIDEYARGMISGSGSTLFEELGLYYIGPVDGHKMSDLVDVLQGAQTAPLVSASQEYGSVVSGISPHDELPAVQLTLSVNRSCDCHPLLSNHCTTCQLLLLEGGLMCHVWPTADVKNTQTTGPVLIHVITDKGRGYDPAVTASDRMHGVGKFDKATGKQFKTKSKVRFVSFGRKTCFVIFAGAAASVPQSLPLKPALQRPDCLCHNGLREHTYPEATLLLDVVLMETLAYLALQAQSYTNYFADALLAEAERDSRIVGIHAAMGGGTGMNRFSARFPERTFDVGIAEQHAVRRSHMLA